MIWVMEFSAEQRAILDSVDPERRRQLLSLLPHIGDDFPEQNEEGVDISLILENLRLSPEQRLERNARYRRALIELRKHVRRLR